MRYQGGKDKLAKKISEEILSKYVNSKTTFVEPFIGGLNISRRVAVLLKPKRMILSDVNEDLIALYIAFSEGWRPPFSISEKQYFNLRRRPTSPLRTFTGFCCSWGGKWWGGYARDGKRNFASEGRRNLEKTFSDLSSVKDLVFLAKDYQDLVLPKQSVCYCDPPYEYTTGYPFSFNHDLFWDFMSSLSRKHKVLVSSYAAREGWECVWSSAHFDGLGKKNKRTERIFSKEKE
jgi:DNA adenine methylase